MKRILLLLLLPLLAAPLWSANTIITQVMTNADGTFASGQVKFVLSAPCLSDGTLMDVTPITRQFNGTFTISLAPNDTCVTFSGASTTTYSATWTFDGNPHPVYQTFCVISSVSPISIVEATACVPPSQGTLSLATITNAQLATLTNSQLATLVN